MNSNFLSQLEKSKQVNKGAAAKAEKLRLSYVAKDKCPECKQSMLASDAEYIGICSFCYQRHVNDNLIRSSNESIY